MPAPGVRHGRTTVSLKPLVSNLERIHYAGLTSDEARERLKQYGPNVLTPPADEPWWVLYLEKYHDPVIRILIVAAFIAIVVGAVDGHYAEGVGIIIAILLATTLAFLNEYKAGKEFAVLSRTDDDTPVHVRRNGTVTTVPRRDIVPDDVLIVEKGHAVSADAVIVDAVSLEVNESQFTGEAEGVRKYAEGAVPDPVSERAYPCDRLYRGTTVVEGHGTARVIATGDRTEIGATAKESLLETDEQTPLNRQLEKLSKLIGVVGTGMALLTFVALVARGVVTRELVLAHGQWLIVASIAAGVGIATIRVWLPILLDGLEFAGRQVTAPTWLEREGVGEWLKVFALGLMAATLGIAATVGAGFLGDGPWIPGSVAGELLTYFMIAVTIIVVAVPEGLAMSVTLSLAYSIRKMTATNNLVRRMHACETIGAATVICSDKTGTLTMNEMRVYDAKVPHGSWFAEAAAANSTAHLDYSQHPPRPIGSPTEGALLVWLHESGIEYMHVRDSFNVVRQWTFSTERKLMATLGTSALHAGTMLHVKGAPELILERCTQLVTPDGVQLLTDPVRSAIQDDLQSYQSRAMRTLGFAARADVVANEQAKVEDVAMGLTWLGFIAIADPVRADVPAAIEACHRAGIDVKIVTGDNPATASEIGRAIGLLNDSGRDRQMLGRDFAPLDEADADRVAGPLKILSRARPSDKMKLVQALQRRGEIVAVTGDGANDAPALNHANVGLAMGKSGTAIAKQASDIILLDDSFQSIVNAVLWGRSLYENIQRFILFQLTINVAALGIAFIGPFIGVKLPLTVTQMLWINLIMDTFAALALATEPPHPGVMNRPPRRPDAFIITPAMGRSILGTGTCFLVVLIGFLLFLRRDGAVDARELSLFFSVFVLLQFWNLFNARSLGRVKSALSGLFANKAFLVIAVVILLGQIAIVQFGGAAFRTEPLSWMTWLMVVLVTSPVLLIGECWRWVQRQRTAA
jgi:Ca2+-transporting ATPase